MNKKNNPETELYEMTIKETAIKSAAPIITAIEGLMSGDLQSIVDGLSKLCNEYKSIPDQLLWNNFFIFLNGENNSCDYERLRKLSEKLENGNKRENVVRILSVLNNIDDSRKAKYISNLTQAFINDLISSQRYYFLYVKAAENLINEDLVYLSDNVEKQIISEDDDHFDEFLANALIYQADDLKYYFSPKAYDVVEFGVRWPNAVNRLKEFPPHVSEQKGTYADIDRIINNEYNESE